MDKAKIKRAFADGLAVMNNYDRPSSIVDVVDNAHWDGLSKSKSGTNKLFQMVLAEENTDNIMLELKTIVDEAFERVSDEILETFED